MKNSKLKKFILLIIISLSIFYLQTVAYSAMSSTLSITGNAMARVAADVRITGFRLASTNNGVSYYEEYGKNHVVTGIELANWMSSITYYVEVTNYGSSDVGIYSISGLPSGLTYTINNYTLKNRICDDTGKCNQMAKKTLEITIKRSSYTNTKYSGDIQLNFDFRPIYNVTYEGITNNNYPTGVIQGDNLSITFRENLNRVLITSNGTQIGYYESIANLQTVTIGNITSDVVVKQKPYVARLVRGDLDTEGSEVCIADECFYIISSDQTTVRMFAKYNLHVGSNATGTNASTGEVYLTKISNPTGRQDPSALGGTYDARDQMTFPWVGVTSFASRNYWWNRYSNSLNNGFTNDITAGNYTFAYVYNNSSSLYTYFNNYKTYLSSLGVTIDDVRPISIGELEYIGCSKYDYNCYYSPDFVRSTSYWTGHVFSTTDTYDLSVIVTPTIFGEMAYNSVGNVFGARPVVDLPRSEISPNPEIKPTTIKITSGNIDTMGSEVCFGTECFHVLYSDEYTVNLIAKYNLEVGWNVTNYNENTDKFTKYKILNASGKQSSRALGVQGTWENPVYPIYGTIDFSPDVYWWDYNANSIKDWIPHHYMFEGDDIYYVYNNASTTYPYVESYKSYIESLGIVVYQGRLPSYSEIEYVACQYSEDCSSAPSWLNTTSYWMGSAYSSQLGGIIKNYGPYGDENFQAVSELLGIRPVLVVARSMFN